MGSRYSIRRCYGVSRSNSTSRVYGRRGSRRCRDGTPCVSQVALEHILKPESALLFRVRLWVTNQFEELWAKVRKRSICGGTSSYARLQSKAAKTEPTAFRVSRCCRNRDPTDDELESLVRAYFQ